MYLHVPQTIDKHSYMFAGHVFIELCVSASIDELRAGIVNNKLTPYDLTYAIKHLNS